MIDEVLNNRIFTRSNWWTFVKMKLENLEEIADKIFIDVT